MLVKPLLKAIALFCLLLTTQAVLAQTKTVTGKVSDDKGNPVAGASVLVKGAKSGTSTGVDGAFKLNAPSTATTLIIGYVGFADQEVTIPSSNDVSVSLTPESAALTDVVVVGYGTARKKDVTGSVASVQAKDFNKGQINSPQQLLQGKVAGLQITNSSGQPGGFTIVKIRGNNSIRTGNTPLYVIDGIPLDGRAPRPGFNASGVGTSPSGDPLTYLNPSDIASMDVLKDASASAIYGSRGANGVILITTKKGTTGPAKLEAGVSLGYSDIMRKIDILDAAGYRSAINKFGAPKSDSGASVDPFKALLRSSLTQNYSLALSGGTENGKYRASFFAGNQDGIILKTNLKKYVGNFNGQYRFFDKKLSFDFNVTAANVGEHISPISQDAGSTGNLISLALIWNPTLVLKRSDGTYNQSNPSGQVNPLALSSAYNDITNITTLLASATAGYKFTPWLEYKLLYGVNYGSGNRKSELQGWIKSTGGVADGQGLAGLNNAQLSSQIITHTLNFNTKLSNKLSLNAVGGYEYWKTNYSGNSTFTYGFDYNLNEKNLTNIHYYDNIQDGKQGNLVTSSYKDPAVEIQSYFARAVFNYEDKYLLTGTFRTDGSNKFGKSNRYASFPSVAAAWNITNEDFMKNSKIFNSLKLRVGYGATGNQEFPADAPLDVYRYTGNGSIGTSHFGNDSLKWETVKSLDIGLDFAILKGRVWGSVDYFNKKTTDPVLLVIVSQPTAGGGSVYKNLTGAHVTNKGIEGSIGADVIQGKNFNWTVNANVTFVKNKFIYPAGGNIPVYITGALSGQGTSNAYSEAIANNQPINVFYLPTFKGFDKDGIAQYDPASYVGDPNPSCFMGFSTDVSYKKWSLGISTNGVFGNKLFNNTALSVLNISNIIGGRNIASGLVNAGESTANAISPSTRFLESGSFVKLSNATIRYNVGSIGKVFKNVSMYVSGNNLFVISKYKGFDPEVNTDKALNGIPSLGIDYIGFPTQRTFLFGFNFTL